MRNTNGDRVEINKENKTRQNNLNEIYNKY